MYGSHAEKPRSLPEKYRTLEQSAEYRADGISTERVNFVKYFRFEEMYGQSGQKGSELQRSVMNL